MRKTIVIVVAALIAIFAPTNALARTAGYAWPHAGGYWPLVIVQNESPDFPVARAVRTWGHPIRIGKCSAHPKLHCIRVVEKDWGNNGIGGTTPIWATDGTTRHPGTIAKAIVKLNRYYGSQMGYSYRLQVTLHELGHAMGLDHDPNGVMQKCVRGTITRPTAYEYAELRELYRVG